MNDISLTVTEVATGNEYVPVEGDGVNNIKQVESCRDDLAPPNPNPELYSLTLAKCVLSKLQYC